MAAGVPQGAAAREVLPLGPFAESLSLGRVRDKGEILGYIYIYNYIEEDIPLKSERERGREKK